MEKRIDKKIYAFSLYVMIIDYYPEIYPLKQLWDPETYTCNALATIQQSTEIEIIQKILFFVEIWFA